MFSSHSLISLPHHGERLYLGTFLYHDRGRFKSVFSGFVLQMNHISRGSTLSQATDGKDPANFIFFL